MTLPVTSTHSLMSSTLPRNNTPPTAKVSQNISSLRGVIRVPVKRGPPDEISKMNVDNRNQNNTLAESGQDHLHGKSFVGQDETSHPTLGFAVEVDDEDDVAGNHSMDYLGRASYEGGRRSRSLGTARPSPPSNAYPPTQTSGNYSQASLTSSALPDDTRSRHVPRGPVARTHPTMPPTITLNDNSTSRRQTIAGHSDSISNPLPSFINLGIGVGEAAGCTATNQTEVDTPYKVLDGPEVEPLSDGPGRNTSPAAPNLKSKQELPRLLPPLQQSPPPTRPLASAPQRAINKPPIPSKIEAQPGLAMSTTASHSKFEQGDSDSDKGAMERKIVRPLPAVPDGSNGSASKSGDARTEQLVVVLSSPPSSATFSKDSLMSPHKMDNRTSTELGAMDKNNLILAPRAASTSRTPAILKAHNWQSQSQATGSMTNNKDQLKDEKPTLPVPRRSVTIGVPSLSRDGKPPLLSMPSLDRHLSWRGFAGGRARLSPSVIIRPLPLPLSNLPLMPSPNMAGTEGSEPRNGQAERRRSRLMLSMPALPLQGSSRGTRGHEEADDFEDEDDDIAESEEDEANAGVSGQNSASSSSHMETPRSNFDSETSMDEVDDDEVVEKRSAVTNSSQTLSRKSSYETARAEPSPVFWDADCTPAADPVPSGFGYGPSMALDRKLLGKVKKSGDDKGEAGDAIMDAMPAVKNLARGSNSKGHGVEVKTSDFGAGTSGRSRTSDGGSGSKVVATPIMKVAQAYDSEGVLEGKVGSGSAGRGRLNPNNRSTTDAKNKASPRPPLPLEPLRAAVSTAVKERESILGGLPPGDRSMRSNNSLSSTSTTPLPSPKLRSSRVGGTIGHHNEMYRWASRSLIDVHAMETKERVEKMVRDQEQEDERKRRSRLLKTSFSSRKVNEGAAPQKEGKWSEVEGCSVGPSEQGRLNSDNSGLGPGLSGKLAEKTTVAEHSGKTAGSQEGSIQPLRRRRSMPTRGPPSYSALFAGFPPGLRQGLIIQPREDEGKEKLPPYTNAIYIKEVMPRKMEFKSPGVQAKDRKWRRVLCVLEGTALRVYKCPARSTGVSAIGEWWENKVGVGGPVDTGTNSGLNSAAGAGVAPGGLARDIEFARVRKSREGGEGGQPVLQINNSRVDGPKPQMQSHQSALSHGVTKSALTFAVQLLKPSATRHLRSNSEAIHVSGPSRSLSEVRRASLNIPRVTSSGRTTPNNDGPGSMHWPSGSATHLTIHTSSGGPSRPLTPASSGRPDQTRMGQPSVSGGKLKGKRAEQDPEPDANDLIRMYTMQHAESGLGKDYTKRPHVIRVRLEGEQFLLQSKNVESVVAWIEGLQSAANVALDLDERPMPAGPMLPRRRRRRRIAATSST